MMSEYLLSTSGLTKQFGKHKAVNDVNLHVKKGAIYGFIGRNGAGKTTFLKMICGLSKPTYGEIELFGYKNEGLKNVRSRISCLIEAPGLYGNMSASENLAVKCKLFGINDKKYMDKILDTVGLSKVGKKKAKHFSLGMKQRLGIGLALVGGPDLLVLDEPINGLDPVGIRQTRDLLVHLKEACGTTILISSHIISEIEQLADTVGVINKGRMLKEMPMEEIRREAVQYLEVHVNDVRKAAIALEERYGRLNYKIISDSGLRIYQDLPFDEISRLLVQAGVAILNMGSKNDTLEDYFFGMLGEDGE